MKYKVTIEELLVRQVEIEADSPKEAMDKVHEKYKNEEIVLTPDDFSEVTIGINNTEKEND
jgi:hypothetical protein